MSDLILISLADGVQTIRMNRADKKNALTSEMYSAMAAALRDAKTNDAIRCSVILGNPAIFCAGNDIGDFIKAANAGPEGMKPVFDFLEELIMAGKPVVAGVDGAAIGVGTTMLMHCDHVIVSKRSMFKTPFVDLGVVPEAGSSLIGPILMGHHKAFELLVMGETLSPEDAKQAGFVNKIVAEDELEKATIDTALNISSKPPQSLKLSRDLVRGDRSEIVKRMREEAALFAERLTSKEAQTAFAAFMTRGRG